MANRSRATDLPGRKPSPIAQSRVHLGAWSRAWAWSGSLSLLIAAAALAQPATLEPPQTPAPPPPAPPAPPVASTPPASAPTPAAPGAPSSPGAMPAHRTAPSSSPEWVRPGRGPLPAISTKDVDLSKLANQSSLSEEFAKLSALERMYTQHVTTLSNPFFEGRVPGTRGGTLAAEYIEFYFRGLGLKPLFPENTAPAQPQSKGEPPAPVPPIEQATSYRQVFSTGTTTTATVQHVEFAPPGGQVTSLTPGVDFNPLGVSASARATGPVVFVGYGLDGGQNGYESFAGMPEGATLEGKIALVLRFEPMDKDGRSRWSEGGGWTNASSLPAKLSAVAKRKPAGIVLVNPPGVDDPRKDQLEGVNMRRARVLDVPVVQITTARAEALVAAAGAGVSLMDLRQKADDAGGLTDLAGATVTLDVKLEKTPILADNVAAVLPGKGALASEYLVIGGHYDHVGYGAFGSRASARGAGLLHPGADDNASGASGVLLAAQMLATEYAALPADAQRRSIIFIGFSGEEGGLFGSRYYVRHNPVAQGKTYAMLNMDMIGRLRNGKIDLSGTGSAEGFEALIKPLADASGLKVRMLPGGEGPSDHASFYTADIPCLHFFTGLHATYHMPEDFWWTLNPPGAVKVVALVTDVAKVLAARAEPLPFKRASGPSIMFDDPSDNQDEKPAPTADKPNPHAGVDPAAQPGTPQPGTPQPGAGVGSMGGVRVRFGIAPDNYDDELPGVPVGEVYKGTSADDAGIKVGDRLIKWNGEPIKGVQEWMPFLSKAKPGDEVEVTLVRDKQEMTVKVKLKAREAGGQ